MPSGSTTGSVTLSASSTGYARSSGSFLTDNFRAGMELTTVSGFAVSGNNVSNAAGKVITAVTALTMSCTGNATDAAASGRVLTAGLPYDRWCARLPAHGEHMIRTFEAWGRKFQQGRRPKA